MKRLVFIPLLYLIIFSVSAQKATIRLIQTKNAGLTDWQILDDQNKALFSGTGNIRNDSLTFGLDPGKYYFFRVSVTAINNPDTSLYSLLINGEPILLVKSAIGTGDHIFPFFTGVKAINAKITGGTDAPISDYPWQVYYISGNERCGGSIISNKWIVTAEKKPQKGKHTDESKKEYNCIKMARVFCLWELFRAGQLEDYYQIRPDDYYRFKRKIFENYIKSKFKL